MNTLKDALSSSEKLQRLYQEAARHKVVQGPQYQCATCRDLGWITVDVHYTHPDFGKTFLCPNVSCPKRGEIIAHRQAMLMRLAEIPAAYKSFTFDSWMDKVASDNVLQGKRLAYSAAYLFVTCEDHMVSLKEANEQAGRPWPYEDITRNSLILQGAPGVGKTGLAVAIANALVAARKQVLWIRVADFIAEVYRRYSSQEPPTADDVIRLAQTAPVLILDDFNISNATENRQDVIEQVIRYRYNNGLPMIVTCNFNRRELEAQWGSRTIDALMSMAHLVAMGGAPLRDTRQLEEVDAW